METLQFGSSFEKARAAYNLRQVNVKMVESQQQLNLGAATMIQNQDLQSQMVQSQKLVQDAGRQLQQTETEQSAISLVDNRKRMNLAFSEQATGLARNRVIEAGANWDAAALRQAETAAADSFQRDWLVKNDLTVAQPPTGAQAAPPTDTLQERSRALKAEGESRQGAPVAATKPQPAEEPQAVQMDALAGDLPRRQTGEAGKDAAPRRGQQSRAAQYQQKLNESKNRAALPGLPETTNAPRSNLPPTAEPGMLPGLAGMPAQNALPRQGGMPLPGAGPAGPQEQVAFGALLGPAALGGQPGQLGPGTGMPGGGLFYDNGAAAAPGLASLDVSFPGFDQQRWSAYRFTTPRGNVQITARALSVRVIEAFQRLGAAVLAVALVLCLRRLWRPWHLAADTQRTLATYAILAGTVSLLIGVTPLFGIAALFGGLCWRLGLAIARRLAVA
jgi:hypothetical protein